MDGEHGFTPSPKTRQPRIADIQAVVCARYGLSVDEMKSPCRKRRLAWSRQVAMYLCREFGCGSYPKIAQHFGNRDHTTALFADRKIKRIAPTIPDLEITLNQLREAILQQLASRPAPPPAPVQVEVMVRPKPRASQPPRWWRARVYRPKKRDILDQQTWHSLGERMQ